MKKSELRNIIREEIKRIINEDKTQLVDYGRSRGILIFNQRDYKFEKNIINKTNISSYDKGEVKKGYQYKFYDEASWERAAQLAYDMKIGFHEKIKRR